HHVVRIGRAQALGEDVGDAGALQHRSHRAAGNYAGSGGGGLEQYPAGSVLSHHLVGDGRPGAGQLDHRALGRIDGFAHRLGDLVGLPGGDADLALAITHGNQGVEGEAPASLHHFGHAVDGDHVLNVVAGSVAVASVAAWTTAATPIASLAAPSAARPLGTGRT